MMRAVEEITEEDIERWIADREASPFQPDKDFVPRMGEDRPFLEESDFDPWLASEARLSFRTAWIESGV